MVYALLCTPSVQEKGSLAACERLLMHALISARDCAGMCLRCALVQRVNNPGLLLVQSCIRGWVRARGPECMCVQISMCACARDKELYPLCHVQERSLSPVFGGVCKCANTSPSHLHAGFTCP